MPHRVIVHWHIYKLSHRSAENRTWFRKWRKSVWVDSYHHWPGNRGCTSTCADPGRLQMDWCRCDRSDNALSCLMWSLVTAAETKQEKNKVTLKKKKNYRIRLQAHFTVKIFELWPFENIPLYMSQLATEKKLLLGFLVKVTEQVCITEVFVWPTFLSLSLTFLGLYSEEPLLLVYQSSLINFYFFLRT